MNYWIGVLGTWIIADGVASLWQYTKPDMNHNQSWIRDHSLRVLRILVGLSLLIIGWFL